MSGAGVPTVLDAVIFDLDGVLTDTAAIHFRAWKETFDELLAATAADTGGGDGPPRRFEGFTEDDYLSFVDGKPRDDGVASFLASRGLELPRGTPEDPPGRTSVWAVGNRKNRRFRDILERDGIRAYDGSLRFLGQLEAAGVPVAVASSSRNARRVLAAAGLARRVEVVVDGVDAACRGLAGKPAPDVFLAAARELGAAADRTVVVEDALSGVQAAVAGGFGLVLGIARHGDPEELAAAGADRVAADLGEIDLADLERWFREELAEDGWKIRQHRFDPERERTREALFTLGNGVFATRGAAEEARAGAAHYPGTYLTGVYNRLPTRLAGRTLEHEDLVNAPNWLPVRFSLDGGEWLGPATAEVVRFERTLHLDRGTLERTMVLRDSAGRETRVGSERLVSMADPHLAALVYRVEPLNYRARVTLRSALDGGVANTGVERYRALASRHLELVDGGTDGDLAYLLARTLESRHSIAEAARSRFTLGGRPCRSRGGGRMGGGEVFTEVVEELEPGRALELEKVVAIVAEGSGGPGPPGEPGGDGGAPLLERARRAAAGAPGFAALARASRRAWGQLWRQADVTVEGDRRTQKLLRFQIHHLLVTAGPHHTRLDAGLPARGLHGEAYRGHVFWDEIFALPFWRLHLPDTARALLMYRVRRLEQARANAAAEGLPGALYPWQSGSDGREETPGVHLNPVSGTWGPDHSRLQRHVSLAVAYNLWSYTRATDDMDFLHRHGAEVILETARYWAAKAEPGGDGRWSIRGVMGPDEFHETYPGAAEAGLTNNAYTNVLVAWLLGRAAVLPEMLPPEAAARLLRRLDLRPEELGRWEEIRRGLAVPMSEEGVLEQFEGFFGLDELDWEAYRARYGKIGRLDRLLKAEGDSPDHYQLAKQADTVMLFYLLPPEELERTLEDLGLGGRVASLGRHVDVYDPRTSGGSTLSALVYGRLAHRLGRREAAWARFEETLSADFADIQGGTTAEGIHVGAMAGSVLWVLEDFAGIETRGERLAIRPAPPAHWRRLGCRFHYRGSRYALELELASAEPTVSLHHLEGPRAQEVEIVGRVVTLEPGQKREVALGGDGTGSLRSGEP